MTNTRIPVRFLSGALALVSASALVAGAVAPAAAQDVNRAPQGTATKQSDQAAKRRYCVISTFSGSRLPKKVCKTREEWIRDDGFDPLAKK